MADGAVTDFTAPGVWIAKGVLQTKWTAFAGTTTSAYISCPNLPDKTVSAAGTWGSATLVIEGSDDATNWIGLNDTRGESNAISFTADNMSTILENPRYIRAKTTGGTNTALTVTITAQSTNR